MVKNMKRRLIIIGCLLLFLSMIPLANYSLLHVGICHNGEPCVIPVWFYPLIYAPSGVIFAGLAFVLRDILQRLSGLALSIYAVLCGTGLSYIYVSKELAIAACSAYFISELADTVFYSWLQRYNLVFAVLVSSVISLVIDSIIFLHIAFHSYHFILGQIIGKLLMVILATPLILLVRKVSGDPKVTK
jgi:uncharacterized PurR-regulated membrane protein YhhQ (DUF165 family)